ncbi:SCO2524 family protein [Nocardia sp. NBC_01377]|uniref:SCO2524 family protein n=1 Tax=Nocardia sp. NBC_01377 TaxID=2903595 RepID=UPI0032545308
MRIQPRQQILDIWSALLAACYRDGTWNWDIGETLESIDAVHTFELDDVFQPPTVSDFSEPERRPETVEQTTDPNSVSDSEQLHCLLFPATEIDSFALDREDLIESDVRAVLSVVGGAPRIGSFVIARLEEYIERNTRPDGEPDFASGRRLRSTDHRDLTAEQRQIEVVDAYSMSLSVCVAGMRFLRVYEGSLRGKAHREFIDRIDRLSDRLSTRLTAAMTGLVRSFVVNTMSPKSPAGQVLLSMLNQDGRLEDTVLREVRESLERVRARLRNDITLGQTPDTQLDDEGLLFECGWTWGIAKDAASVGFIDSAIARQPGIADTRPYLYFTIIALDGINDLISQRTRELDLLSEDQYRLAESLRIRWDLTQRYWSTVARFGPVGWPLEDIPWRTTDGDESDYYSLIVSAVLIQDLVNRTASDDDLTRAVAIFDELARRGRIVRRPTRDDPAVHLHMPGVQLSLVGTEEVGGGPRLQWQVSDFAPVLLKRTLQAARLSGNIEARDKLMQLAETTMDHIDRRMLRVGPAAGLWDDPGAVFGGDSQRQPEFKPSWYMTERMIESLVTADRTFREVPLRAASMVVRAVDLLNEADHLFNQVMLGVSVNDSSDNRRMLDEVEEYLTQARRLIDEQPGTSFSLASVALFELNKLTYARRDATRGA